MKQIIFLLLVCLPVLGWAQVKNIEEISLSGTIVNENDEPIPFVTVTNTHEQNGVVSDDEGFFLITFDKNDTLELSAVGFKKHQIYLGDTATADNYDLNIRLSEKTYQLENVTVFAFKDEEAFKKAILALDEDDLPKENPKIVVPGSYNGPRTEKRPSLASPLSFVFDRFSKRARYEREAREAAQAYAHQKLLSKKFNRDLVGKITGLKDRELDDFMLFCQLADSFVDESNEYDIILAIDQCYRDFKEQ